MWLQKSLLFVFLWGSTAAICNLNPNAKAKNDISWTITCRDTNTEDYQYDITKLNHDYNEAIPLEQLNIVNSNFPVIENLFSYIYQIPVYMPNNFGIKISQSHVKTIAENAFANCSSFNDLDLSFNEIEDLEFLSHLPLCVRNLNLRNNKISYIDFRLLNHFLDNLDLSFNKISEIDFSVDNLFISRNLNLERNEIVTIVMPKVLTRHTYGLSINIASNPLKYIKNCNGKVDYLHPHSSIALLNLSGSLNYLPLKNVTRCKLKPRGLITSNSTFSLDADMDYSNIEYLDYSKSSITHIPRHLFENKSFDNLNLSYNDFEFLNETFFSGINIRDYLDLSHCNIKNVHYLFHNSKVNGINLSHNNIYDLNPNSLKQIQYIGILNLSFNKLKLLKNNSFLNCRELNKLILSHNNMALIEDGAFNGLKTLSLLDLSSNHLKTLKTNIFKPLNFIDEIDLQNNQLTFLQSELFSSIPVHFIKLSGNNIKVIQAKAFYNLSYVEFIQISNNNAILKIEKDSFSHLYSLKKIDFSNSGLTFGSSNIFCNTPILQIVDIKMNPMESIDFSSSSKELMGLRELHITLKGEVKTKSLLGLEYLTNLTFWNSRIKILEKKALQGLFHLKSLEFKNTEIDVLENGALDGLFNLEFLNMENIFRNSASLNNILFEDLRRLSNLNLSYQGIQYIIPHAFRGLKNLEVLYLNNNKLRNFESSTFSGLQGLKILDLSYNCLKTLNPNDFLGLDGLKYLNLANNSINETKLGSLQHFPHIEEIVLTQNNLTEFKIGVFSNLYELKKLNLANNTISHLQFESFLTLHSLKYINLEFNNLKSFGNYSLVKHLNPLKWIGIAKNKWPCNYLEKMLVTFRYEHIDFSSEHTNFYDENVEGIECIDVCRYLLCIKDTHGIN